MYVAYIIMSRHTSLSGSKMEIALEILRPPQNQEEHLQVYWEGFLPDPKEKQSRTEIWKT